MILTLRGKDGYWKIYCFEHRGRTVKAYLAEGSSRIVLIDIDGFRLCLDRGSDHPMMKVLQELEMIISKYPTVICTDIDYQEWKKSYIDPPEIKTEFPAQTMQGSMFTRRKT